MNEKSLSGLSQSELWCDLTTDTRGVEMSETPALKVGDELAFAYYEGSTTRWEVKKIDKITPSGRIKIGHRELNPDLTVRGSRGWNSPREAQLVTDDIRRELRRQRHLYITGSMKWKDLSDDQLGRIVAIIQEGSSE